MARVLLESVFVCVGGQGGGESEFLQKWVGLAEIPSGLSGIG